MSPEIPTIHTPTEDDLKRAYTVGYKTLLELNRFIFKKEYVSLYQANALRAFLALEGFQVDIYCDKAFIYNTDSEFSPILESQVVMNATQAAFQALIALQALGG